MDRGEALALQTRMQGEVTRWRAELWHAHGDYVGENWHSILEKIEGLQRELLILQEIIDRKLTANQSVVFGD